MPTPWVNVEAIGSCFESLSDPRHTRNRKHLPGDIVVVAVCGLVCRCDGPTAIHRRAATLLKRHPIKDSLKGKMIRCMLNTPFLTEVLTLQ